MPTTGPHEVAFAIRGPIRRADLPGLCDRVCAVLAESTAVVADCDVAGVDPELDDAEVAVHVWSEDQS